MTRPVVQGSSLTVDDAVQSSSRPFGSSIVDGCCNGRPCAGLIVDNALAREQCASGVLFIAQDSDGRCSVVPCEKGAGMREQLELLGLEECLRRADSAGATDGERRRLRQRIEAAHQLMTDLPGRDDLAFLHSGLCQTYLPHSRLSQDWEIWRRSSGRSSLMVQPGLIDDTPSTCVASSSPSSSSRACA